MPRSMVAMVTYDNEVRSGKARPMSRRRAVENDARQVRVELSSASPPNAHWASLASPLG